MTTSDDPAYKGHCFLGVQQQTHRGHVLRSRDADGHGDGRGRRAGRRSGGSRSTGRRRSVLFVRLGNQYRPLTAPGSAYVVLGAHGQRSYATASLHGQPVLQGTGAGVPEPCLGATPETVEHRSASGARRRGQAHRVISVHGDLEVVVQGADVLGQGHGEAAHGAQGLVTYHAPHAHLVTSCVCAGGGVYIGARNGGSSGAWVLWLNFVFALWTINAIA